MTTRDSASRYLRETRGINTITRVLLHHQLVV